MVSVAQFQNIDSPRGSGTISVVDKDSSFMIEKLINIINITWVWKNLILKLVLLQYTVNKTISESKWRN